MLAEFRKLMLKALVGYIKMREGRIDHLDFSQGINAVLFNTRSLSAELKRHVLNIYQISHDIKFESRDPVACMRQVFDYMQENIKLGFFSSHSKQLRDVVIHAMESYDASYIRWRQGRPVFEARMESIASVPDLVVTVPRVASLRSNDRSPDEEIATLSAQLEGLMRQRRIDLEAYHQNLRDQEDKIKRQENKITELVKQLRHISANLADIVAENFTLKDEVDRLRAQGVGSSDAVRRSGVLNAEDQETGRQRFTRA